MFFEQNILLLVLQVSTLYAGLGFSDITVIPENFTVGFDQNGYPSNNLTIVCVPPTQNNIQGVTFIQLRKYRQGETDRIPVATLRPSSKTDLLMKESGLANRKCSLSGMISPDKPADSFLRVEFSDGSCWDEGEFECIVHFYVEDALEADTILSSATVTTKTPAEQVIMMQKPHREFFVVNEIIELHCSSQVGSPPAYYRWQYRHTVQASEKESDFEALTFGVTHSEGPHPQGFCKYFRSTTLWLRAELDLNGVEIRCVPMRNLDQYENLSASFVLNITEAGCVPDCWNGGVCVRNTCFCPPHFTGSFCEQAVEDVCEENCDDTSKAPTSTSDCISLLPLICIFLCSFML